MGSMKLYRLRRIINERQVKVVDSFLTKADEGSISASSALNRSCESPEAPTHEETEVLNRPFRVKGEEYEVESRAQ